MKRTKTIIISPDESRGYTGLSHIVSPPPEQFPCVCDNSKSFFRLKSHLIRLLSWSKGRPLFSGDLKLPIEKSYGHLKAQKSGLALLAPILFICAPCMLECTL